MSLTSLPHRFARLVGLLFLLPWLVTHAAAPSNPEVRVQDQDGALIVDITYRVPVSQRVAWDVLTDFEAMPGFVPNLDQSRVLQRDNRRIVVEQKGHVSMGLLNFPYESKREIDITPYQGLRSHSVSGTKMDSTTLLAPTGNGTLLTYHAVADPELPFPANIIASSLSDMLASQFKAMGQEMLTRAKADDEGKPVSMEAATQTTPAKTAAATKKVRQAQRPIRTPASTQ